MKYIFLCLVIFTQSICAEEIVLNAIPISKVTSGNKSTIREELSPSASNGFRLLITKDDDDYLWSTRDNDELSLIKRGAFIIFISRSGSGYIEIFDTNYFPENDRRPNARYKYKEHIRSALGNITYWGVTNNFSP